MRGAGAGAGAGVSELLGLGLELGCERGEGLRSSGWGEDGERGAAVLVVGEGVEALVVRRLPRFHHRAGEGAGAVSALLGPGLERATFCSL